MKPLGDKTLSLRTLTTVDLFYFFINHVSGPHVNRHSLKEHLVEGPVTHGFTLHFRIRDPPHYMSSEVCWDGLWTLFFLLGSHNFFVVTALGSCVKWGPRHAWGLSRLPWVFPPVTTMILPLSRGRGNPLSPIMASSSPKAFLIRLLLLEVHILHHLVTRHRTNRLLNRPPGQPTYSMPPRAAAVKGYIIIIIRYVAVTWFASHALQLLPIRFTQ